MKKFPLIQGGPAIVDPPKDVKRVLACLASFANDDGSMAEYCVNIDVAYVDLDGDGKPDLIECRASATL